MVINRMRIRIKSPEWCVGCGKATTGDKAEDRGWAAQEGCGRGEDTRRSTVQHKHRIVTNLQDRNISHHRYNLEAPVTTMKRCSVH